MLINKLFDQSIIACFE